jgi:hypothetical protein
MVPSSRKAIHSVQVPASFLNCRRPISVKGCSLPSSVTRPLAMSCSGLWSSNSSAILPMRESTSPWRTTVLWQ